MHHISRVLAASAMVVCGCVIDDAVVETGSLGAGSTASDDTASDDESNGTAGPDENANGSADHNDTGSGINDNSNASSSGNSNANSNSNLNDNDSNGNDNSIDPLVGIPARLVAAVGVDDQSAAVVAPVPVEPVVIVLDALGDPVPAIEVSFSVVAGGGAVESATGVSDGNGEASPGTWTLGATAGNNTLRASVNGIAPLDLNATGLELELALVSGDQQTAEPETALAESFIVEVTSGGEPQADITVVFEVERGSLDADEVLTDSEGRAEVIWTMGAEPGLSRATARVSDSARVEISAAAPASTLCWRFKTPRPWPP